MRNRLILNSKLGLRIEKHDVFTKELSKITLRANNDKKIQPIDSIGTYTYRISKDLKGKN